jgi:serine O-acetyltransferase
MEGSSGETDVDGMWERDFSDLVSAIKDSYLEEPRTRHIEEGVLPNRDEVVKVIHLLRELLFPGYFGKLDLAVGVLDYHIGNLLVEIYDRLLVQVENAFRHEADRRGDTDLNVSDQAERIVREFLAAIPEIRATLATDAQAALEGDPAAASLDEIIFSYPGFFAISVYRLARQLHIRNVPLIPRMMTEYAHNLTGIDIHPGAVIGEQFFIDHGTGVVIGETTVVGKRVKIYQGVTLGALSTRGGQRLRGFRRHPTLEDDVTVYSGASILGGETIIGRGVVISSNVFITQSVPAQTRVTLKNPELQYRDQTSEEFKQEYPLDWCI